MLWAERLLGALAPAWMVALAYLVLAVFGLANGWVFLAALALLGMVLVWEAARLRPPEAAEIDQRIETTSGLQHRPLAALEDIPATQGEWGAQIWRAHQARMALVLGGARAGWPAPFAARRDPLALRGLLLLLLVCGVLVAGPTAGGRIAAAFVLPAWPFATPEIDAWISPPAYTGQSPELLGKGPVTVLLGSGLSVIESGADGAIRYAGRDLAASPLGQDSRRADGVITASGVLTVGPWWHRLARWQVTAAPAVAPELVLDGVGPGRDPGTLELRWEARDPYGLSSLTASLRPKGYEDAMPQTAALPPSLGASKSDLDVADSPFAGMQVTVCLKAENLAGLTVSSAPLAVMLPAPDLHDPTAMALAVLRRNLALVPARASAISGQMFKLAKAPPSAIGYGADAQLAMLASALALRSTSPANAVARMLVLIQQIEAGPDYAPGRQLAQASQALLRALAQGPPDAAALNRLLAAMQQALAAHLQAVGAAPPAGPQRSLDSSALSRLAEQIAADEQAGRLAQAQAELQELAQMLEALRNARPMTAAQAARAQAQAAAARNLTQLMQDEASLLDQTGQGSATPDQQARLHDQLDALRAQLGSVGMPNLPGLPGAGADMQAAQTALGNQDSGGARSAETATIQHLQQAAAALQKNAQQEFSIGGDEMPNGDSPDGAGEDFSLHDLSLPGHDAADAIEQEIIQEDANPSLAPATHEYLRRLLSPGP